MGYPDRIIVLLLLALPLAAAVVADDATGVARLQGRWLYAGGEAERQARLVAIEATVQEMPWIMRGLARRRIRAATEIPDRYLISLEGETITIVEGDEEAVTARWDGTPVEVPGDRGDTATQTLVWGDDELRAVNRQPKGSGTTVFRLSPDGRTMDVTATVSSPRLPSDIVYVLSYRREE